ncbi:aminotransferase class III-fold pyridoxal phosphate-dependent enzyme [Pseudomonas aeruginosa]
MTEELKDGVGCALDSLRLMRTQERPAQVFVRGQGSWLWDSDGRAFLDFTQGLAVNCLGHSPSVLVQALAPAGAGAGQRRPRPAQTGRCWHWRSACAWRPAATRPTSSPSGAEANEAAIALARKWGRLHRGGAQRIVSTVNSNPWTHPGHPDGLWQAGAAWPGGFRQGAVQRPRRHGRGHRRRDGGGDAGAGGRAMPG